MAAGLAAEGHVQRDRLPESEDAAPAASLPSPPAPWRPVPTA